MADTRARIVQEATRQLTRVGYAAFTVAAVRDALGLSSGSMFHAFPSKPALAAAVYVEGMAAYQRSAVAAITRDPDPLTALRALIRAHLRWIEEHRGLASFLFATQPDEVVAAAALALAERNAEYYREQEALFRRAAAAGVMRALPRAVAHTLCLGAAQEYGRLWTRGVAESPPTRMSPLFENAGVAALSATKLHARPKQRRRKQ